MLLRCTTVDELRERFAPELEPDAPPPAAVVADALRAHAHVLGPTMRRTLVRAAQGWLGPLVGGRELGGLVEGVLASLLGLGDLTGPRGVRSSLVAPAPLRAILVEAGERSTLLLVGGPPTSWLSCPFAVEAPGLRVVRCPEPDLPTLTAWLAERQGALASLDAWTRCSRRTLDATWLEAQWTALERGGGAAPRLEGLQVYAPALERPGPARSWRSAQHVVQGLFLARGRDERGQLVHGVLAFTDGRPARFSPLSSDQACELTFALDRGAGSPRSVRFVRAHEPGWRTLEAPFLPRAEYRLVAAVSRLGPRPTGERPRVAEEDVTWLMTTLAGRLGVRCLRADA